MKEFDTLDQLMEHVTAGTAQLVNYEDVCSDRLVWVHDHGTLQQRMETLDRSEYKIAVPINEDVKVIPLEDSAA